MTIHLSKDLEQIVHDAVRAGLYAREDDVLLAALTQFKETLPKNPKTPAKKAKRTKPVPQKNKPLTIAEVHQQMLASGLMSQLPDTEPPILTTLMTCLSRSRASRFPKPLSASAADNGAVLLRQQLWSNVTSTNQAAVGYAL